jgi:hypothetical protein
LTPRTAKGCENRDSPSGRHAAQIRRMPMVPFRTPRLLLPLALLGALGLAAQTLAETPAPAFTLPPLPYASNALEPAIDTQTMEIHHGRHHKAYVDNLNAKLADFPDLAGKSIEDIMAQMSSFDAAVRNNGGGHYNHSLFWELMAPPGQTGEPSPGLLARIEKDFGSLEAMKKAEHAGVVGVEQRVLDAGEAGALAALDDDGVLRIDHVEDRHAVDRAGRVGLGHRVDHVVGADDERHVGVLELGVDVVHVGDQVVGHAGLGEQHVHVARHAAGDRVDRELDLDAALDQLLGSAPRSCAAPGRPPGRSPGTITTRSA